MVHLFWVSRSSKWSYYRKAEGVFRFFFYFKLKAYLKKKIHQPLNLNTEAEKLWFTYLLSIKYMYSISCILEKQFSRHLKADFMNEEWKKWWERWRKHLIWDRKDWVMTERTQNSCCGWLQPWYIILKQAERHQSQTFSNLTPPRLITHYCLLP